MHALYNDILSHGGYSADQWHSRRVSPYAAFGSLLAHWRTSLPFVVLGVLAGNIDDSTLQRAVAQAEDLMLTAACNPRVRGCVRPLTVDEIGRMMPEDVMVKFGDSFPLYIADCLPLWTTKCAVNHELSTALFDGTHYINRTWAKFQVTCLFNGYVIAVHGPFQPGRKASDGLIFTHSWLTDPALRAFVMNTKGTALVDYGYRGSGAPGHMRVC